MSFDLSISKALTKTFLEWFQFHRKTDLFCDFADPKRKLRGLSPRPLFVGEISASFYG
jgi:hypothetical protein